MDPTRPAGGRYFAHAPHEDYFVFYCKIRHFTPQKGAKMTPFRLLPDDFRPLSIEILSDFALGRAAKAGLRLRLSRLSSACYGLVQDRFAPCYLAQPLREQFIAND